MSRVIERAIDGEDGSVSVRNEAGGHTTITWFCGDRRRFTSAALEQAIEDIDTVKDYDDVWLEIPDAGGQSTFVQLEDGDLYANIGPTQGRSVSWKQLKRTLAKMG